MTFKRPLALALAACLLLPAHASAQSHRDVVDQVMDAGAMSIEPVRQQLPIDHLGRPNAQLLEQAKNFAANPWLPPQVRGAILAAVNFFADPEPGEDTGGPGIPQNAPMVVQFAWPTVAGQCIGGQLNAVGSAIAVPGPAEIPLPGAQAGQTVFLFTALGTSPAAVNQGEMVVEWFNLHTLRGGRTVLGNYGVNPDGPATLSATADTGSGPVVAWMHGAVHTEDARCDFAPTAALVSVP